MHYKNGLLLLFIFGLSKLHAQYTTTGDATAISCNCFEITADEVNENGSFHKDAAINLNTAFNFKFTVNFGCESTGGEGMAFVLQNAGWNTGNDGAGIGYEDIAGNVLSVEFDTRNNDAAGEVENLDIASDHISLQDNGDTFHEADNPNNLLGTPTGLNSGETPTPHEIKPGFPEMEDCEDHLIEINWTPGANQTIEIIVDGITSLTYIGDMIDEQFGGNPNVLWGWTGSTGVLSNIQTVCLALEPDFSYTPTNCPGEEISFSDNSFAFNSITDWSWDFGGIGSSAIENPSFTFDESGEYEVVLTITDDEGCENSITIPVPVGFDTEVIADDDVVCIGESTILHAQGLPFEATECCFKLVLNDAWGDYWGSGIANEIEIIADGVTFGTYTPTSYSPGTPTSDTIDLCFDQGTELELIIHGEDSPFECEYIFLDADLTELIAVDGGSGEWEDGLTETHTVDCGIDPPSYVYQWDNPLLLSDDTDPNPTATITDATWFHVEITDPETGCTIIDSIEIDVHPPVTATISGDETICAGDEGELIIEFTGPAPYTVEITGPSGTLPLITDIMSSPYLVLVDEDGGYSISFVSGDGCEGTFTGTGSISVIVPFNVDIESSATYCEGESIEDLEVVSTDGGEVNWYDNPGLIPPAIGTGLTFTPFPGVGTTTYYAAETEDILGCQGEGDAVTITINPVPPAPTYTGETEYCESDVAEELIGIPSLDGTITWYDDAPPTGDILSIGSTYTPILAVPGTTLYITETADGCESEATEIEISVSPTPEPPVVDGITEYCEGDPASELTATIASEGTIEWYSEGGTLLATGTTYIPALTPGESTILVYEVLGGCQSDPTEVTILVQAAPYIDVLENFTLCRGDSIQINADHNGYEITWSDGQSGPSVWFKPETTSTYTVTATNPACGSSEDVFTITVYNPPHIEVSNDTVIGLGGEVNLWAYSEGSTFYEWSPEVNCITEDCSEITAIPESATLYIVTVRDDNNCLNSDTVFVDLNGIMEIFVPNIFSPNNDGSNDKLFVYGPALTNFNFEIYDRWGKRVYRSDDQKEGWDGTFKNELLAPQTFVYRISGENVLGEEFYLDGNVTIIK
ncbi:lectin-like domain-containing protein [Crocinitomix algicola]|uniref:lectin-like domain-containing protein n=1 Tax=Crocinitomix algicola TaxID=1740263 RepID=UPI00087220A8|nr:gliding motility-associated C-terminal domain-containing protein [Crocinitomix algicola]